jgi:Protein of unknown function (DUF3592)
VPDCAARTEKIAFKLYGVTMMLIGLTVLGLSGWLAWVHWVSVARWPQTNAVLVSKDISTVGARLVFRYAVYGRTLTGVGFCWGSEASVRTALESYSPGTIHRIAYDPADPRQVEANLHYNWALFGGPISFAVFAAVVIGGGVLLYRSGWA